MVPLTTIRVSFPVTEASTNHQLHEARQTPEGLHLILGDEQEGRKEITHPLHIPWTDREEDECQRHTVFVFIKQKQTCGRQHFRKERKASCCQNIFICGYKATPVITPVTPPQYRHRQMLLISKSRIITRSVLEKLQEVPKHQCLSSLTKYAISYVYIYNETQIIFCS